MRSAFLGERNTGFLPPKVEGGVISSRGGFANLTAFPSSRSREKIDGADDGIDREGVDFQPEWFQDRLTLCHERRNEKQSVSRSRKQARARPGKKAVRFGITRQVTEVSEEGGIAEGFRGRSKLARFHRHRADPETERPVKPIRPAPGSGLLPHQNSSGASLCGSLRD